MSYFLKENIQNHEKLLNMLLEADALKYSEWPPPDTTPLKSSSGIYHFFQKKDGVLSSIYVGKAGFGTGNWNLYERLKQHFQPSQNNALLGKASKALNITPDEAKNAFLCDDVSKLALLV